MRLSGHSSFTDDGYAVLLINGVTASSHRRRRQRESVPKKIDEESRRVFMMDDGVRWGGKMTTYFIEVLIILRKIT